MKTALISDIHGNVAALTAVLEDIDRHEPDAIICLGDFVGYGPEPRECLEIIRKRCKYVLMGNHEHAVLNGAEHFTPLARIAIDWTAQQLRDPSIIEYLTSLRPSKLIGRHLFVHGSVRDPLFDYVREADSPWMFYRLVQTLRDDFKDFDLCFVGHNHRAFLGTEIGYIFPHDNPPAPQTRFQLEGQKAYVSIGSVGQPRDGDPRASWVMFDGKSVNFHRVDYDRQRTIDLIHKAGLPEFLADRLIYGE
jgi:predicted phosphodiesterase